VKQKWPFVPLGKVLKERREEPSPDDLAAGRIKVIAKIGFDSGQIQLRSESNTKTGMILIQPGDLVVSGINAAKGAIAIYGEENKEPIAATIHFGAYVPNKDRVEIKFLWWLLRSQFFRELLLEYIPGGIKTELKAKRLLPIPIPLPPLPEQQRIVARIEELAAQINEAHALRQQAEEEAKFLMTQVAAKAYDDITKIWRPRRLDDLCRRITDGTHLTPRYVENGVPFLSVKDITSGRISFDNVKYITPEEHAQLTIRCKPVFGDVLLTKVGTTGFAKAIDVEREFSIFVSLALLKLKRELLDPRFAECMLNSARLREYSAEGTRGVGNKNLVLKFIREFPMPSPPLPEQLRIVAELDALQTEVDTLKHLQSETAAELDALLPSILDRAFKGELFKED